MRDPPWTRCRLLPTSPNGKPYSRYGESSPVRETDLSSLVALHWKATLPVIAYSKRSASLTREKKFFSASMRGSSESRDSASCSKRSRCSGVNFIGVTT